jgi:hypothetical protein
MIHLLAVLVMSLLALGIWDDRRRRTENKQRNGEQQHVALSTAEAFSSFAEASALNAALLAAKASNQKLQKLISGSAPRQFDWLNLAAGDTPVDTSLQVYQALFQLTAAKAKSPRRSGDILQELAQIQNEAKRDNRSTVRRDG